MPQYDIAALERALEQAEEADAETHKLLNNLGLGHSAAGRPRAALRAHRREKQACKRLASAPGAPPSRLVDLAIAYRRCGDAMLKLDALEVGDAGEVISARVDIARRARDQHAHGLRAAAAAADAGVEAAATEVQAACAAMSQSSLIIAMDTKERADFEEVARLCGRATALAQRLADAQAGGRRARESMLLSAAVNLGIALSGLGERANAKALFETIAVRAKESGDTYNMMRGIANRAEEAGEDGDWQLCVDYVDEWILLAKGERDEAEEGEALRKRGTALFEMRRFEEARSSLNRAALISRDDSARGEARGHLELVEKELEELKEARAEFEAALGAVSAASNANEDVVAEAVARLRAGEAAFQLRKDDDVVEHLQRYFTLVDDYGCVPGATGVDRVRHASAVANMGETCWRQKRFSDAVDWGMKELTAYEDDVAGQAQAWCNIGVYLDDDGKYESAKKALNTSMSLAKKAGDVPLCEQAERNLSVVIENQREKEAAVADAGAPKNGGAHVGNSVVGDQPPVENSSKDGPGNGTSSLRPSEREHSIVVDSSGNGVNIVDNGGSDSQTNASRHSRELGNGDAVSRRGITENAPGNVTSTTGSRSAADRGDDGTTCFLDLVALFRKQCGKASQHAGGAEITPRSILLGRLRPLSAKLIACEEGDVVDVNFSTTFLCDDEVPPLIRTVASLPAYDPQLNLDFSLNPFVTSASIRWLSSVSSVIGPPRALPSIVTLDLSGTGIDASCLSMLARALCPLGTLPNVKSLAVGKNALGRQPVVAAEAVARLLLQRCQLQFLDLSLNLFSYDFFARLVTCLEKSADESETSVRSWALSVTSLDLRLNNRREPTALLEAPESADGGAEAPADLLRRLVAAVPSLRSVDIRACGAGDLVRKPILKLRKSLLESRRALLSGAGDVDDSVEVIVVSPGVFDPLDVGLET